MNIKSYRIWLLCSAIIHVLLLIGVNAMSMQTPEPPEKIVQVKFVPIEEQPKPPKPKPVTEPVQPIPPDPKSTQPPKKPVVVEKVKRPEPRVKTPMPQPQPVEKPAPKPRVPQPPAPPQETPPAPVKPDPTPPRASAPPAVMRASQGKMAVPPGRVDSMGQQGTAPGPPAPPPPPPPPPGPTYDAGSLGGPTPGYPKLAQEDGLEGTVTLTVHVKASGDFTASVARSSGHSVLDTAALSAIKSWRFKPAMKNGELTTGTVSVRFTFNGDKVQGVAL